MKSSAFARGIGLCVAAATAYVVMNEDIVIEIVNHVGERSAAKSLVYSAWLACGFLTFLALIVAAPRRVLWPIVALVFVSLTTNYAYHAIVRDPLTVDVIQWLPYEVSQLGNASHEYTREIALAALRATVLLAVFIGIRAIVRRAPGALGRLATQRRARSFAPAAFAAFVAAGIALQPPSSVAETNLFVFGVPMLFESDPSPQPLALRPARDSTIDKVVVVIDESVTREAYEKLVAPRTLGLPIIDFGEAASTTNCSAPSNALLRWGVDRSHVGDAGYDPRTNPTIWAYARAAGYRTTLIDGQSKGQKQNYLTRGEIAMIDAFVPAQLPADTDVQIVEALNAALKRPGRDFIVIVKHGAHFPYEMNYPPGMVDADASRTLKYVAAVANTTGRFFERLARDVAFDRTLLVYTSDHGQDLSMRSTHCNPHPRPEEYSVPLVAITKAPALAAAMKSSKLVDRASHLNIFPTIAEAFGYDAATIERTYGPTLAGAATPYLTYVNRGWRAQQSRSERHTVRTSDFVESAGFPYRPAGEPRRTALDSVNLAGSGMQ